MPKNQFLESWITSNLPEFEPKWNMESESEIRQKHLLKSKNIQHSRLAAILNECSNDEPCGNVSCPVCYSEYRKRIIYETIISIKNKDDYCIVTLIFYSDAMTDSEVTKDNLLRIKNNLYQQLYRIGFSDSIIGGFEFDFHTDIGKWMPHFHLLVKKDNEKIELLRKYMNRKSNLNSRPEVKDKPMMVQDLEDPPEQISYLFKFYAKEIRPYINNRGERNTKDYRLTNERHCLYLYIRSILNYSGLIFTYGERKCKKEQHEILM